MGGNQEVREVDGIDLTSDGGVVPGRAGVFEDGAAIGGDPDEAKRGSGEIRGGGAEVMDRETRFINFENFGEVKGGSRYVADRDDGGGEQGGGGNEIMVRGRRGLGRAERANVYDSPLKLST